MQEVPKIICRGGYQPLSVEKFCKHVVGLLKALSELDPCFDSWGLARPSTRFSVVEKLNDDFSNTEEILFDEFKKQSEKKPTDFLYTEDKPLFTKEAVSAIGLRASFYTFPAGNNDFDWSKPCFKLTLNAGADSWDNLFNCILEFPVGSSSDDFDKVFVKKAFCEMVSYTDAKSAFFETAELKRRVQQKVNYNKSIKLSHELQVSRNLNNIGSLLYINYPICGSLDADVQCEEYNGGSLITISDDVYDASGQVADKAATYYNEMLDKYLYTSHYTFSGLFLSPAELAYKQQIAEHFDGKEHQLKYAFFDTYDKKRNVLVYASLLQVPGDARAQTAEQFLKYAELKREIISVAKRQISVAESSATPIEWHIGTQPQAELLVNIFESEGIDKQSIVVKYTAFSRVVSEG